MTLTKVELRRIDGFQCRCLRVILKIACPFVSRVSNEEVLDRAGAVTLSTLLLRHQLMFFGEVARADDEDASCS